MSRVKPLWKAYAEHCRHQEEQRRAVQVDIDTTSRLMGLLPWDDRAKD